MTKIKIDKDRNSFEIEGEEKYVKDFFIKQLSRWNKEKQEKEKEQKKYKNCRQKISNALLAFVVLLSFFLFTKIPILISIINNGDLWNITLVFVAGLIGLFTRNLIFLSKGTEEKSGKNLCLAYFAYFIFVCFSSIFIFSWQSEKIYFAIPLNFLVGLMTYDIISAILNKLSKYINT